VTDAVGTATDASRLNGLVSLITREGFTHVSLYGLEPALQKGADVRAITSMLSALRASGVREVWIPVAGERRVERLATFVREHPALVFDGLVTEFEYWNRCDSRSGEEVRPDCFPAFRSLVASMRALASTRAWKVGAYLGLPTRDEATWIAANVDFVLLDFPGVDVTRAAQGSGNRAEARRKRLSWFSSVPRWPILYARGELPFSASTMRRGLPSIERAFSNELGLALPGVFWFADDALARPASD